MTTINKIKEALACEMIVLFRGGSDGGYWFIGSDGKLHHIGPMPGPEGRKEINMIEKKVAELRHLMTEHPGVIETNTAMKLNAKKLANEQLNVILAKTN